MKHLFFDLDGTLCESRQQISPEMKDFLMQLPQFVVISGLNRERMLYQLDDVECTIMTQSGNDAPDWQNKLTDKEVKSILRHIKKLHRFYEIYAITPNIIENRGCQITLSLTGHDALTEYKKNFDSLRHFRSRIIEVFPFFSKTLKCTVAGTTSFDYTRKNGDKGHNIARYIKKHRIDKDDCIYFGDALREGENDESVIGVIQTVGASGPEELMRKIKLYA